MDAPAVQIVVTVLRVAIALAFIAMGVNHFLPRSARTMAAMIPPAMLRRSPLSARALVALTGVCEIAGGLGLLWPPTRLAAGIALVVFLACVFPANAYAAGRRDRFGALAIPLVPRLIGQVVLAALVLLVAIL